MDDLFRIERLLVERQHRLVGDHIVDEVGTHSSRIAEIAHLDGRGAVGEDAGTGVLGVALQVDRDVDVELVQKLRDVEVALRSDVVELIERPHQAGPHIALIVATEGDADNLEARAIVQLEQLSHQEGGRMPVEIRGQIGDSNLVMMMDRSGP